MSERKMLLVGDNPFHGISHLSQERATFRGNDLTNLDYAASLVKTSLDNEADGFMFSVSETTLSILKTISNGRKVEDSNQLQLYAILPYAYEFVRLSVLAGGIPGLVMTMARQIACSRNFRAVSNGLRGIMGTDPVSLYKSYLLYEYQRIQASTSKKANLASMMLHEVVTDMALALNMQWIFKTHIEFNSSRGIKPGFETRNFAYLVGRFEEWGIDFRKVVIAAPFNSVGFQMCPSREECEKALMRIPEAEVIGFSILAAGYVKLPEAANYISNLHDLDGIAVGVSKEPHACETFKVLKDRFNE